MKLDQLAVHFVIVGSFFHIRSESQTMLPSPTNDGISRAQSLSYTFASLVFENKMLESQEK